MPVFQLSAVPSLPPPLFCEFRQVEGQNRLAFHIHTSLNSIVKEVSCNFSFLRENLACQIHILLIWDGWWCWQVPRVWPEKNSSIVNQNKDADNVLQPTAKHFLVWYYSPPGHDHAKLVPYGVPWHSRWEFILSAVILIVQLSIATPVEAVDGLFPEMKQNIILKGHMCLV